MYPRFLTDSIETALSDTPVVFLNGARQVGKSTLAKELIATRTNTAYVTLDDATSLASATSDPSGFIHLYPGSVAIDEVQRAPELFLAIKASIDQDRRPGRYLLTGSADILLLPSVSDSLAGRMEILKLWPLSQGEILGRRETFIDSVFDSEPSFQRTADVAVETLLERVLSGGFPPALERQDPSRRTAWYSSYVTTMLQRDVRDLANLEGFALMPRLLALLGAHVGKTLSLAELGRSAGIPSTTLRRYLTLLEVTFLIQTLPAWSANLSKRLVRMPKVNVVDSGLAAHLAGLTLERLRTDPTMAGPLLENFVVMELRRQAGWSQTRVRFYHFRAHTGEEVDLLLENAAGEIVGIEVKASRSVTTQHFKGLRYLAGALGTRFRRGIVLYAGSEPASFGENMFALPFESLWT